MIQLIRIQLLK